MRCVSCGAELPPRAHYCALCGHSAPTEVERFRDAATQMAALAAQRRVGALNEDDLLARRQRLALQDDAGRWWLPNPDGSWFWYDGTRWSLAVPPALAGDMPVIRPHPSPRRRHRWWIPAVAVAALTLVSLLAYGPLRGAWRRYNAEHAPSLVEVGGLPTKPQTNAVGQAVEPPDAHGAPAGEAAPPGSSQPLDTAASGAAPAPQPADDAAPPAAGTMLGTLADTGTGAADAAPAVEAKALVAAAEAPAESFAREDTDGDGDDDRLTLAMPLQALGGGLAVERAMAIERTGDGDAASAELVLTFTADADGRYEHIEVIPKAYGENVEQFTLDPPPAEVLKADPELKYLLDIRKGAAQQVRIALANADFAGAEERLWEVALSYRVQACMRDVEKERPVMEAPSDWQPCFLVAVTQFRGKVSSGGLEAIVCANAPTVAAAEMCRSLVAGQPTGCEAMEQPSSCWGPLIAMTCMPLQNDPAAMARCIIDNSTRVGSEAACLFAAKEGSPQAYLHSVCMASATGRMDYCRDVPLNHLGECCATAQNAADRAACCAELQDATQRSACEAGRAATGWEAAFDAGTLDISGFFPKAERRQICETWGSNALPGYTLAEIDGFQRYNWLKWNGNGYNGSKVGLDCKWKHPTDGSMVQIIILPFPDRARYKQFWDEDMQERYASWVGTIDQDPNTPGSYRQEPDKMWLYDLAFEGAQMQILARHAPAVVILHEDNAAEFGFARLEALDALAANLLAERVKAIAQ